MNFKKRTGKRFVVCVNNEGYEASLEKGKLYQVIPDRQASAHGYLRVIDESGEDYGFSEDRFVPIEVPLLIRKALAVT